MLANHRIIAASKVHFDRSSKKRTSSPAKLDLSDLGKEPGLPALTTALGQAFSHAAGVCLEDQGHGGGHSIDVTGLSTCKFLLYWPEITDQIRRTHNDLQDATRDGAYAIAISLSVRLTEFAVVEQSRKGGGFDYWLGRRRGALFDNAARLEVSGILNGTASQIANRVKQKKKQTAKSAATRLPAFVCVVEFSRPLAHYAKR